MSGCDVCNEKRSMAIVDVEQGDYGHLDNPRYSHVGEDFIIELIIPTPKSAEIEGYPYPVLEVTAWPCGGGTKKKRQSQAVPIRYCPMCGRKLVAG